MTDLHLDTAAGVLRFCELRRAEMATEFLRVGRWERRGFSFSGYVFATHAIDKPPTKAAALKDGLDAWKPGAKLAHVEAFGVELPAWMADVLQPRDITAFWGTAIRHYVQLTRAIGTLILSETWTVSAGHEGQSAEEGARRLA